MSRKSLWATFTSQMCSHLTSSPASRQCWWWFDLRVWDTLDINSPVLQYQSGDTHIKYTIWVLRPFVIKCDQSRWTMWWNVLYRQPTDIYDLGIESGSSCVTLWCSWIAAIFTSCLFGISIELEVKFTIQLVFLLCCFGRMFKTALLLNHCVLMHRGAVMYVLFTVLLLLEAKLSVNSSDSTGSTAHPINNTTSAMFDRCTALWAISNFFSHFDLSLEL